MTAITEETVRQALTGVTDPETGRDVVDLEWIDLLNVCDNSVKLDLRFPSTAYPHRDVVLKAAREAIQALEGIRLATVGISLKTPPTKPPFQRSADAPTAPVAPQQLLPNIKNVIAISSGKGGVGKTSVTVNIACALTSLGYRVGIVDADIYGPNVPIMMGMRHAKITGEAPNGKPLPIENHHVKVMSVYFLIKEEQPVVWRGPLLDRIIRQFLSDFEWGELDFLLVDLPPGTGDAQLTIMQAASLSGAIIVTTPQEVALHDSRKGLAMFLGQNIPCLGIIENMSYFECDHGQRYEIFGHGGGQAAAEKLSIPFLGEIPLVIEQREKADQGIPMIVSDPDGKQATIFREISEKLIAQLRALYGAEKVAASV